MTIKRIFNSVFITKVFVCLIFFLVSLIYVDFSSSNKENYEKLLFTNSLSFNKFNNWYSKYFGEVIPGVQNEIPVFSNNFVYTAKDIYLDGEIFTVQNNLPVSNLSSGVVVFVGQKEGYGNTVIVQGNDGYDIWYGNLTNINVLLYDYLQSEVIIGEALGDSLYLVIKKNNEFYTYEDYKN